MDIKKIAGMVGVVGTFLAVTAQPSFATVTYEHLPGSNSNFISHHQAGGPILADDFAGAVSGTVTRVDWWGTQASSNLWELTFHTNSVANQPNIDNAFSGGLAQHLGVTAVGVDPENDGIFFYTTQWLPQDLTITAGTSYWFSVANFADWNWALGAAGGPTVGSESFDGQQSVGAICGNGGPHCGAWNGLADTDFAFRVHVPEPATLALMGLGLAGLGFGRQRGKRC